MNIQITRINNGWITAVSAQTPQGPQNSATYSDSFDSVLAELAAINEVIKQLENVGQIISGSPEDR
jgi:hypothetical protein